MGRPALTTVAKANASARKARDNAREQGEKDGFNKGIETVAKAIAVLDLDLVIDLPKFIRALKR